MFELFNKRKIRYFVIYTKGRTGSSPIANELNSHPALCCHQELLRDIGQDPSVMEAYEKHGADYINLHRMPLAGETDSVLPFDLFMKETGRENNLDELYVLSEGGCGGAGEKIGGFQVAGRADYGKI